MYVQAFVTQRPVEGFLNAMGGPPSRSAEIDSHLVLIGLQVEQRALGFTVSVDAKLVLLATLQHDSIKGGGFMLAALAST
jgi:hypothetical protein